MEGVGEREREREKDRERERERDNKERDRDRDRKPKIDRWFNLETPDSDFFPRELRETYKAISATGNPAPLFIHVLLSVPKANASGAGAGNGNVLVALAQSNTPGTGARISIEPTPRYVLLEKWELKFIPRSSLDHPPSSPIGQGPSAADGAVALPTIYKHGIPLFRSLYSLLRILPVWRLYRRLRKRTTGPSSSQLTILLRVSDRDQVDMQHGDTLLFGMFNPLGVFVHCSWPSCRCASVTYTSTITHPNARLSTHSAPIRLIQAVNNIPRVTHIPVGRSRVALIVEVSE